MVLPALVPAKPSEEWLVELLCQPWRFRPQFPLGPGKGCLAWGGAAFVFGLHINPRTIYRKTRTAPGTHALPAPRDIQDPPHQIIKCGSRNYTKLRYLNYLGDSVLFFLGPSLGPSSSSSSLIASPLFFAVGSSGAPPPQPTVRETNETTSTVANMVGMILFI